MSEEEFKKIIRQKDYVIKDSGKREEFTTGAVRDTQDGKGMPHLLPTYAILELSKLFEAGCRKYGKSNWRKGIPLSRYLDSAFRHWCSTKECLQDENHSVAVMWNMACFIETAKMIKDGVLPIELDDIGWIDSMKVDNK